MSNIRYSAYRVMRIFVLFDLPTQTKVERKEASNFRKRLIANGFCMFQFSVYMRHCSSRQNAKVHVKRVKNMLPKYGKVCLFEITDKQFGMIEIFYGRKQVPQQEQELQLKLF